MKKFDFKLKGLLKIREFAEQKVKAELGEIVKQINDIKTKNLKLEEDIDVAYHSQEKLIENMADAQTVSFYPFYIRGKREHIKNNENLIYSLQKQYDKKLEELHKAKADVKVIEGLKEKEQEAHKKEVDKKLQEILDESTIRKEYMKRISD